MALKLIAAARAAVAVHVAADRGISSLIRALELGDADAYKAMDGLIAAVDALEKS